MSQFPSFRRLSLTFLLASTVGVVACKSSFNASTQGRLRVVHDSPDAPAIDALVDGKVVVSNLAYGNASPYNSVDSGSRALSVNATGTSTSVINARLAVMPGQDYTVLATNKLAAIEPLVLTDNNTDPTPGNVKVRVVHGSPTAGPVDVYITAPGAALTAPALVNVAFKGVSSYLQEAAGTYQIRVTATGTQTVLIDSGSLTLSGGAIRTVIARDPLSGSSAYGAIILADKN